MKKNWVHILFATQCLLPASCVIAQARDCKADRAQFVTRNNASVLDDTGDEYKMHFKQIAGSLSQLIAEVTVRKLNAGATASEITGYLGCLTKVDDSTLDMREFTNAPVVLIPQAADPPQAIVATYPIVGYPAEQNWGIAPSRPTVQCFSKNGGRWSRVGELGGDYSSSTFSIYPLTSPVQGQTWSLLAGRHIGDTGGRLLLEVVVCDGKTFTKKWSRDELLWGKVEVDANGIVLSYEKEDEHGIIMDSNTYDPNPVRFTEVLHVTPNGLE